MQEILRFKFRNRLDCKSLMICNTRRVAKLQSRIFSKIFVKNRILKFCLDLILNGEK